MPDTNGELIKIIAGLVGFLFVLGQAFSAWMANRSTRRISQRVTGELSDQLAPVRQEYQRTVDATRAFYDQMLNTLTTTTENLSRRVMALETANARQTGEIANLQMELEKTRERNTELTGRVNLFSQVADSQATKIQTLEAQQISKDQALQNANAELDRLRGELAKVEQLKAEIAELRQRIITLENENAALHRRAAEVDRIASERNHLIAEVARLQQANDQLAKQLAQVDQKLLVAEAELQRLRALQSLPPSRPVSGPDGMRSGALPIPEREVWPEPPAGTTA